jgi:hypothetical protein
MIMDRLHVMGIPTRRGVMASHPERPYCVSGARLPNTEQLAATTLQLPIIRRLASHSGSGSWLRLNRLPPRDKG